MTDITLTPITGGYNVSKINDNFDNIEQKVNEELLHRTGGNNTMLQDLDMNGHSLLNVEIDLANPDSLLTVGEADTRYYNVDGDTLTGPMNVNGHTMTGLREPVSDTEAVRKVDLDTETAQREGADTTLLAGYTAGDINLQAQMTGEVPLEASAFSSVSWNDQQVENSLVIPDNKNAWSFGPTMTIAPGQTVVIGTGSFWTIANGGVL